MILKTDISFTKVYNKIAAVYDRKYAKSCVYASDLALSILANQEIKPRKILDIGCGTGILLERILSEDLTIDSYGIDPASEMLSIARNKLPNTTLYQGKAEDLPFPNASFDTIVSTVAFSHWYNKKLALEEVSRVLSPNGVAIIIEHAMPSLLQIALLKLIRRLPEFIDLRTAKALVFQTENLTPCIIEVINHYLVICVKKNLGEEKTW